MGIKWTLYKWKKKKISEAKTLIGELNSSLHAAENDELENRFKKIKRKRKQEWEITQYKSVKDYRTLSLFRYPENRLWWKDLHSQGLLSESS